VRLYADGIVPAKFFLPTGIARARLEDFNAAVSKNADGGA